MGENKGKKTKKSSKTPLIIVGAVVLVIVLSASAYTAYSYSQVNQWNNMIYPGVKVETIDISGKTREEAIELLKNQFIEKTNSSSITTVLDGHEYILELQNLDFKYNIEEIVDEAVNYGKDLKLFSKYSLIKNPVDKSVAVKYTYNEEAVNTFVNSIAEELNKEPVNAKIKISGGDINVTPDVKGYKVNTDALIQEINNKLISGVEGNVTVQASAEVTEAGVTAEMLNKIDTKISSFTTNYSSSTAARAHNVDLAAKFINGTVLMPGETFSYNKVVGERTKSRGFQEAGVFVGDKVELGVGGGICQVSSTLYAAAMNANLRSVTRRNHSMPVSYMDVGMDATVVWGAIDYQFKNNYDFPVYLQAVTSNRNLTFNIYGSGSGMGGKTYKLTSETLKVNEPSIQTIEDPTMKEGTTSWDKKPVTGYVAKSYLITYQNGKEISRDVVSTDTYKTVNGILRKGTKKVQSQQAPADTQAPQGQ